MHKYVKYLPALLLLLFVGKSLGFGASPSDAIIILALAAIYAIETKKEPEANQDLKFQVASLQTQLVDLKELNINERLKVVERDVSSVKDKVTAGIFTSQYKR
jgi:hypothetical protein